MKRLAAILVFVCVVVTAEARLISSWPYSRLAQEADCIAVVEVDSITNAPNQLLGHGDPERFQGKTAHLKVGWVVKGELPPDAQLLFFAYSGKTGRINGALFISFKDHEKQQYLMFLKRDGDNLIPVTGHYDAAISVKVIAQDRFSRISR